MILGCKSSELGKILHTFKEVGDIIVRLMTDLSPQLTSQMLHVKRSIGLSLADVNLRQQQASLKVSKVR